MKYIFAAMSDLPIQNLTNDQSYRFVMSYEPIRIHLFLALENSCVVEICHNGGVQVNPETKITLKDLSRVFKTAKKYSND